MSGGEDEAKPFLGRYQLQKKIAVGGMAELYLAQVSGVGGFQKQVVVKRILPQLAESEELFRMFLDEARIAATLDHPNVVQVYDSCEENGEYFMAMEYLDGTDLRTLRKVLADSELAIPWEHAIYIISNIAAGLHYAHEKCDFSGDPLGIVHRDVTPHNIFLTCDGVVKLVDFGIAQAQGRMTETAIGTLKGKLAYMSPEQCRGEPLDRRSDIYSLGIILYELTTGRRIYRSSTEFDLMNEIVDGNIRKPSALMEYPGLLEKIVLRCLRRDPSERYQTAQELQAALESFAQEYRLMLSALSFASFLKPLLSEAAEIAEERWKHKKEVSPLRLSGQALQAQGSSGQFRKPEAPRRSPSVVAEMKRQDSKSDEEDAIPAALENSSSDLSDMLRAESFDNDELTARVPTDMLAKLRDEERETAEKERQEQADGVVRVTSTANSISANVMLRELPDMLDEMEMIVPATVPATSKIESAVPTPRPVTAVVPSESEQGSDLALKLNGQSGDTSLSGIPEPVGASRSGTVMVDPLEKHPSTADFRIEKPGSNMWIAGIAVVVVAAAVFFVFATSSDGDKSQAVPESVEYAATEKSATLTVKSSGPANVWMLLGRTPIEYSWGAQGQQAPRIRVEYDGFETSDILLGADAWSRDDDGQTYIDSNVVLLAKGTKAPESESDGNTPDTAVPSPSVEPSSGDVPSILRIQSEPSLAKTWLFVGTANPELRLENIAAGTDVHLKLEVEGAPPVFRSVLADEFDDKGQAIISVRVAKGSIAPRMEDEPSEDSSKKKKSRSRDLKPESSDKPQSRPRRRSRASKTDKSLPPPKPDWVD